jgi:hypothetical protein
VAKYGYQQPARDVVALRLLRLLSDTAYGADDWEFMLDYIKRLPPALSNA